MGNQSPEKIIEKIRKVLELSKNNPSQAEAESAALKAQELMAKHHLSMKEIEAVEETDCIEESSVHVGSGNRWKYLLADIVARNFRCKYFMYGIANIVFYGYKEDTEIAAMTFEFLFKVGNKAAANYYQKKRKDAIKRQESFNGSGIKNAFLIGYLDGIEEALEKQSAELMIVVPKEVEESYADVTAGFKETSNAVSYGDDSEGQKAREEGIKTGKATIRSREIEGTVRYSSP